MNRLKAGLLAAVGVVVGVVTLRAVRRRRTNPGEEMEDETTAREALAEARAAAEHATVAADHARLAGEKAIEYVREEMETPRTTAASDDVEGGTSPKPGRRLRKVGKGWIRQ